MQVAEMEMTANPAESQTKSKRPRKLQAVPTKVRIQVEFDHPEFIKLAEFLAMSHETPLSTFYGRLIQSSLGSYAWNAEGKFVDSRIEQLDEYIGCP